MGKKIKMFIFLSLSLTLVACNFNDNASDRNNEGNNTEGQQFTQGQISSDSTEISSEQFPHTKAVQVGHAKYIADVGSGMTSQTTREEITQLLPKDVQQLTPELISRFIPEGTVQLSPEEIARVIQEGAPPEQTNRRGNQQPNTPPAQPEAPTAEPNTPPAQPEAPTAEPNTPPAQPEAPTAEPNTPPAQPEAPQDQREREQQKSPEKKNNQPERAEGLSEVVMQVIELTNAERRNNGLSDLQADTQLSNVAKEKSNDMQANNYFSHTSPTYGSPFDMMRDFDISYQAAGENIAQGQQTPEQVVQAWMNSEGHRANILNNNYTHIGVGYNQNGHYWTQMFIRK
ncbi:CAP domain-containing protein [Bacillus solitudinis]|uniref:CAP domain-containing protein n=1 Tax=Bacillus solitudinis TaxID=2014074 RepID=UPI001D0D61CC|nr:CAP domain-containing protein [Bacillus solitudinis]